MCVYLWCLLSTVFVIFFYVKDSQPRRSFVWFVICLDLHRSACTTSESSLCSRSVVDWIALFRDFLLVFSTLRTGIRKIAIGTSQQWHQFSKPGEKVIRCLLVILCLPFRCSWLSRAEGDLCLVNFWKSVLRQKIIWFRCVLTCLIFEVDGNGWWQDKEQARGCGEKSQACWRQRGERWSRF